VFKSGSSFVIEIGFDGEIHMTSRWKELWKEVFIKAQKRELSRRIRKTDESSKSIPVWLTGIKKLDC
jgi:hypothetical protein